MSSLIRRIQRQVSPSKKVHPTYDEKGRRVGYHANPARMTYFGKHLFFGGRGSRLGVKNEQDRALLARKRREEKRAVMAV